MKTLLKSKNLPFLILGLSGIGLALRWALYAVAVDGKNLLRQGHPLAWLLALVSLAAALFVLVGVWNQRGSHLQEDNFRPSKAAAAGSLAAALGVGLTILLEDANTAGMLGLVWKISGVPACLALAVVAKFRWDGKKPLFLLHAAVCIFFAIHMVSCYQGWSSNPQIPDYLFTLLASVGLMLFGYQQTAYDADSGSHRLQLAIGLITAFCCFVSLSGTEFPILYLTGGIWTLTNLRGE